MKVVFLLIECLWISGIRLEDLSSDEESFISVHDLTRPTTWAYLSEYYNAVAKFWKICINCGVPGFGTSLHLDHEPGASSMRPAMIPTEYLVSRLCIIDVSHLSKEDPGFVLSLEVALQWTVLKRDPNEATLILFKFDWKPTNHFKHRCICRFPGLSSELAEWIATNLTHVVGVATDAPSLESEETRELTSRTVAHTLGKSGVYIIENVILRRRLPERGCLAIVMPLMMLEASYVPTRLTAFCAAQKTTDLVTLALKKVDHTTIIVKNRVNPVDLKEIMNEII